MWKPRDVVQEHRSRANLFWAVMLLSMVGYIVWQAVTIIRKFDNPSTNFSVSDDVYPFPRLSVCIWDGQGCDGNVGEEACIGTAFATVYDSCFEELEDVKVEREDECLAFYLEDVDIEEEILGSKSGCASPTKPFLSVSMSWYSSSDPSAQASYSAGVPVFLGDRKTSGYTAVPFSRVVYSPDSTAAEDANRVDAAMTIGKTVTTSISGDSVTTFPTLTLSAVDYDDRESNDAFNASTNGNEAYAFGFLYLTVTQGSHSLTELIDISPLDTGTLLGNIGGFWELLLVAWGICFIATRPTAPTLKARDLTEPIRKGTECICRRERMVDPGQGHGFRGEGRSRSAGGGIEGAASGSHSVEDSTAAPQYVQARNGATGDAENGAVDNHDHHARF